MTAHVVVISFGYLHHGAPPADVTVDVRKCLRDPHINPAVRELTGHDPRVRATVLSTPGARGLLEGLARGLSALVSADRAVTVAIGCAGGRHRSVVLAEVLGERLGVMGAHAEVTHRDVHEPVVMRDQ